MPESYVVVNDLPANIKLKVKGPGYSLLGHNLRIDKNPIFLDVSHIKGESTSEDYVYKFLNTNYLLDDVDDQVTDELSVLNIYPDTIRVIMEKIKSKVIPINLNSRISFEPQYRLYDKVQVKPSAIEVKGPASYIDTLEYIDTDSLVLEKVGENLTEMVQLRPPSEVRGVSFNPETVIVQIPVDKFTESSIKVPIEHENLPDSLLSRTFPEKVEVIYLVPMSKYGKVRSSQLKAVVDFKEINNDYGSKLKVELRKHPDYIQVKRIKPPRVEYILKSKS